ncbi:MAG: PFL_4669 family integrating conjugative element protein [Candidatus Thiodiazotropha endolucinida]
MTGSETVKRDLPNDADPAVDYTTATARPGTLRGDASIVIQTRQAQKLVYGRRKTEDKAHITGLVRFGMNMNRIWTSAGRDDPYADWALLRIEKTLTQARDRVKTVRQETEQLLANAAVGVTIDAAHSVEPVRIPLQFGNAYGYMGAYLISDFDQLVCTMLTARFVGLITYEKSAKALNDTASAIRHAFGLSSMWKFTLVTRNDIRNNTPMALKAQDAMAKMGELPKEIIDGSVRAQIAPEIHSSSATAEEEPETEVDNPDNEDE